MVLVQPQTPIRGLKQKAFENYNSPDNGKLKIEGTLWATYNGAVWAVDWGRKSGKDRVDDLCLEEGAVIKEKALKEVWKLLEPSGKA